MTYSFETETALRHEMPEEDKVGRDILVRHQKLREARVQAIHGCVLQDAEFETKTVSCEQIMFLETRRDLSLFSG